MCAGVIGMAKSNGYCGVGVAHHAHIGGKQDQIMKGNLGMIHHEALGAVASLKFELHCQQAATSKEEPGRWQKALSLPLPPPPLLVTAPL